MPDAREEAVAVGTELLRKVCNFATAQMLVEGTTDPNLARRRQKGADARNQAAVDLLNEVVDALAATIEVATREPEDWPGVTNTVAPYVTEAEAYEVCRTRLRDALAPLRARGLA